MNSKTITTILFIAGIFISSCTKKDSPTMDYPLVNVTSPSTGQTMSKNAIHIVATVSASAGDESHALHELSITVKSLPDSAVIFSTWKSVHDLTSYTVDTVISSSLAGNMVLVAQVENHLDKIATQSVAFRAE